MKFPIFDGHCDTACGLLHRHNELYANDQQVDLVRAQKLDGYAQFFALWTAAPYQQLTQAEQLSQMYHNLMTQLERNSAYIRLCLTDREIESAWAQGKMAALLSIEGAEGINCDPGLLEQAWHMGVRMISLTWNHENALAGYHGTDVGLSEQGREFVRRAQRLGMLIDVSHLSDRGFWDLCDITEGPIVASHSNARAVCGHSRNLTDDMFRQIIRTGGTTGLNMFGLFLTEGERCTMDDVLRHVDHFLSIEGGEKHVSLGGDLDGCSVLPEPMTGVDGYVALIEALLAHGLPEQTVADISYHNFMEVFHTCSI